MILDFAFNSLSKNKLISYSDALEEITTAIAVSFYFLAINNNFTPQI
jgi:hypothetical protein